MGVEVRLVAYATDEPAAREACHAAFERVAKLDDIMSDYRRDSELMRLCAHASEGPVKVSDDLFRVLAYAQEVSRRSDGAFDVTVGPLVQLWRTARKTHVLPTQQEIDAAKSRVGWQLVKLDPKHRTVELLRPGMQLDVGGIAKGYAGDEAIRTLRDHGVKAALFEAGGDIVVSDSPPGKRGWEIELPSGRRISLHNSAVSTSGDTFQYVEINGQRYSHVVDPKTGLGLSEHFIATVVAKRGITTDALSTAVTVLGPECGQNLMRSFGAKGWIGQSK